MKQGTSDVDRKVERRFKAVIHDAGRASEKIAEPHHEKGPLYSAIATFLSEGLQTLEVP